MACAMAEVGCDLLPTLKISSLAAGSVNGSPALPGVWSRANHLIRLSDVLGPSSGWGR